MGLGLLAVACPAAPLHAQSGSLGGTVALSSQLVDRGLAITAATPVVQGELRWNTPGGWSLGVVAGSELRSPRLAESLVQLARTWPVSDDWQLQASLLYYDAPRHDRARPYRRAEADLSWIYRDVLTLNLAATRQPGEHDARTNIAAEANLRWPLSHHLALAAGAGLARFQGGSYGYGYGYGGYGGEARSRWYRYGQAGLVWTAGGWRVELDRITTDEAPASRRGTGGVAPWLATAAWSF